MKLTLKQLIYGSIGTKSNNKQFQISSIHRNAFKGKKEVQLIQLRL